MQGRILYVDRDVSHLQTIRPEHRVHAARMALLLAGEYGADNIDSCHTLDERIIRLVQQKADAGKPYRALITHVPYEHGRAAHGLEGTRWGFRAVYEHSLGILSKIKESHPDLFILAYTGASSIEKSVMESVFVRDWPIDAIVQKSSSTEVESDFLKIKKVLEVTD